MLGWSGVIRGLMSHHLKKPEFPKPRVIREGFMPEKNTMKGYRIKKITTGDTTRFFPQHRLYWFFWADLFSYAKWRTDGGGFESYEEAVEALHNHPCLNRPKVEVEYLYVPYENREPNLT